MLFKKKNVKFRNKDKITRKETLQTYDVREIEWYDPIILRDTDKHELSVLDKQY